MRRILFVCTGNSCRSQMAGGFGRAFGKGEFEVESAGTSPIGILPATIRTMKEVGIDISDQTSDKLTTEMIAWADYVITLCSQARDNCPVIPPGVIHRHWDIENPDRLYFSDEKRRREFARIRDQIGEKVKDLFENIRCGSGNGS